MSNAWKISRSCNNLCCEEKKKYRRQKKHDKFKLEAHTFATIFLQKLSKDKYNKDKAKRIAVVASGVFFNSFFLCSHVRFDARCEHFYDGMICMCMAARQGNYCNAGNRDDVDFNFNDKC